MPDVTIVIPVYNEAAVIGQVIKTIQKQGYTSIIVVDDGSSDNSADVARQAGAQTIRHRINRGKGAATKTGLAAARELGADIVVTLDGDGQHDPADIPAIIQPIVGGNSQVVLGTRLHHPQQMPQHRYWVNRLANVLTWVIHGLWVTDSQSGFRAYSRDALRVIQPRADRYEYDSAIIREIHRHQLRWSEVPITVHYTDYSTTKFHRQNFRNGLKTLRNMLWQVLS